MTPSVDLVFFTNAGHARLPIDNSSMFCARPDISLKRPTRSTAFIRGGLRCVDQLAVIMSASISGPIGLLIAHLTFPITLRVKATPTEDRVR